MLAHPTHDRRISRGLIGMAKAFEDQRRSPDIAALSFEERLGLMVDREDAERDTKRLAARLRFAALRQPAVREALALRAPHGLARSLCPDLRYGHWLRRTTWLLRRWPPS